MPSKDTNKASEKAEVEERKSTPQKNAPQTDTLLQSLVFLMAHFGRAKSAQALTAGLPHDGGRIGPDLFCSAAERLGLSAKVTDKKTLQHIPRAVLPAVLILRDEQACVLLSRKDGQAHIYLPETQSEKTLPLEDLEKDYAGYAILVHPRAEFTNPEAKAADRDDRHWFWSVVKDSRGIYAMAMVGAIFINLFALASPLFIMNVYDRVIPNNAIETGWALGIGALVIFGFDLVMRILRAYLIDFAGRKSDVIAGRRIYDQVLDMRLDKRPASSGVFANMLRDFDSVREFFTSATITALVDLPFSLFFLYVIYRLGGGIVFVLMALIAIVVVTGMVLQAPLKALVKKSTRSSEVKHGLLVETIHGLETIKTIGADGSFRKRYGAHIGENALYSQKSRFVSGLGVNIATFLQQIASIVIVLAGMYMVRDGALSVGGLIACVILGGRAISPIGQIANLMSRYHQASSAMRTLDNIMAEPTERDATAQYLNRPDIGGHITMRDVSFSYQDAGVKALDGISVNIKSGEKVGIVGRIGSGKSTIAKLIMGLYVPQEGTVLLDETDMRQIDPADARRNMAYIAQDVVLFSGSVRDNISASRVDASEEEILEAAKQAGVHGFVSKHPAGYDAQVGEGGRNLSGGQRQAIAMARAFLRKPKLLLCDEPTNAMDMQAEQVFVNYIRQSTKDQTVIIITHKEALLPLVDRLIVMDQGRIVLDGPRDQVIQALQGGVQTVSGGKVMGQVANPSASNVSKGAAS